MWARETQILTCSKKLNEYEDMTGGNLHLQGSTQIYPYRMHNIVIYDDQL